MIGRLLGVDHGNKRVGVAVSDALGISARELTILNNDDKTYAELMKLAQEQQAVGFVIGMPSNIGGSNLQGDTVRTWVNGFKEVTTLPIVLWDEQMSSADATEIAKQQKRPIKAPIDDLAAKVILQSYLNALADGLAEPPSN